MQPTRTSQHRRVLGIDPGLTRCGIGVVTGTGARMQHVAHDTIRTSSKAALPARLGQVFAAIEVAIATHEPEVVAVERVLFQRNVRTAMATGQAAGIALLAGHRAGLDVLELTPTSIKSAVAGHGGADKDAVARMVTLQLGLDKAPTPADAADALAVAMAAILHGGPTAGPATRNSGAGNHSDSWADHLAARGLSVVGGTESGSGLSPSRDSSRGAS